MTVRALMLVMIMVCAAPALAVDTCVECHAAQSAASLSRQTTQVAADVHGHAGLSCHQCHGGDPTTGMDDPYESMDEKKGYIGIPKPSAVAALCAKCHGDPRFMRDHAPGLPTDQAAKFAESRHAAMAARDEKGAATCTACHRAHGILPARDPRSSVHASHVPETCGRCHADPRAMTPRNLPSDVVAEYTASVHWRAARTRSDRAAPVCHDCHGNHAAATPAPAVVMNLCGRCHTAERDAFARGKHARLPGFRGCVECHSNHKVEAPTDALLAASGVCYRCHREAGAARDEARAAHTGYTGLDAGIAAAAHALEPLKSLGLPVTDAEGSLASAREALISARRLIHTDDRAALARQVQVGQDALAVATRHVAQARDASATRVRYGTLFALLALFTSLTLVAKVRSLAPSGGRGPDDPGPDAPAPSAATQERRKKRKKR